ncbi:MAG: DUF4253 domain-containing protein [Candidatus Obscuribacterales bacterium]|nr:DUF4253 domain-containing protein [Cyanobacteria bacterium SZAS LIN-5]RTL40641.1 MAG: DUF4253 domain-containing protein [Candidatus Melainabacteria bacterium]
MEVSKWVCGEREGTLNPAPEAISSDKDNHVKDLCGKLEAANINVSTLGRLNWPLVDMIYSLSVKGSEAENIWGTLRRISIQTGYWPVIAADEDELDGIVENLSCHLEFSQSKNVWTPRKKSYNSNDLVLDEGDRAALLFRDLKELEGSADPVDLDGSGAVKPSLDDLVAAGEKMNMDKWLHLKSALRDGVDEDEGEWPFDVMPDNNLQSLQIWDPELGSRELDSVYILLVRADYAWEVPAKLLYGGWNDCPVPQVHVGFFKRWFKMHDAEIVSIGRATIEMVVERPPSTREEALEIAREHFVYCPDSVDQGAGNVSSLAAELLNGRVWHFWWD